MKIRLGLLNEDIADRFKVSRSLISQIFSTWVRATAKVLSCMIKVWDLDTVNTLKSNKFKLQKLHSIADATEIFIQTPKDHLLQRLTWSNYKHHNALKVIIVIAPSSDIMFISLAYPGSISDKEITKQSGYLDMMEPYTELMVDKGFNISNECAAKKIYVVVPPGKPGSSQKPPSEVTKTSKIAKTRILVEQVIRRLKVFRFIANEVPINMLSHIDDILQICAAISDMQSSIYG